MLDELKRLAAERAATTLKDRVELVYGKVKGKNLGEGEIEKLVAFILEPFSEAVKERFRRCFSELLRGNKKLEEVIRAIEEDERKRMQKIPRLPPIIIQIMELIEKGEITIEDEEVKKMFLKCFPDALKNALHKTENGTYYIITGDIPAMWLRDSSLQVHCYLPFVKYDIKLSKAVEGIIKRQAKGILKDPYAYAFFEDYSIRRRKFELDSLLYFVWLLHGYWKAANREEIFSVTVRRAMDKILEVMRKEQNHNSQEYNQMDHMSPNDVARGLLEKPNPTRYTGMVWSGFRPSDDPCYYNYHIPSQIFALSVLEEMAEIYERVYESREKAEEALRIRKEIEEGIEKYGVIEDKEFGEIYAYEVDGFGNFLLMDDANLPSLLGIPYLNPKYENEIYKNTRRFVLSERNPYFVRGKYAEGIGSPHRKGIWTLSLIVQGLTSRDNEEKRKVFDYLKASHAGTYVMHEAFNPDNPREFTRPWFSMGNSLFSELVINEFEIEKQLEEIIAEINPPT